MLAHEDFTRCDGDVALHQVRPAFRNVARMSRHVVNGDRGSALRAFVGRAAVPGQAMVKHHFAFFDLAWLYFDDRILRKER